ncbi:MAG: MgtC/SapB family protein [Thermodesulfobacteriota bacterium]
MVQDPIFGQFINFGLAALVGFAIGLERDMAGSKNPHAGTRDFILIPLIGAVSGYLSQYFQSPWIIMGGFIGTLSFLLSGYWIDRKHDTGITTEVAMILTFFLGVLIIIGFKEMAISISIVILVILSHKKAIQSFTNKLHRFELQAAIKFLVITFIIFPVFPNQPLSDYMKSTLGTVETYDESSRTLSIQMDYIPSLQSGDVIILYNSSGERLGPYTVKTNKKKIVRGIFQKDIENQPVKGDTLEKSIEIIWLYNILKALNPHKIWLIVILVSFISLVGYIAVKILGPGAGIGLTGFIGGLASSTVTTVSFAKRSLESPAFNRSFAVAILLASAIMFPRLLLEIAIVNQAMLKKIALPIGIMGITGIILALYFSLKRKKENPENTTSMQLANPFCLKSAITFGAIFSTILVLTRLATVYLGDQWLPVVSVISGLVDVDAIAFSLSDAQKAGIISLDWASLNLVIGAISNTLVKLFYVFTLGDRRLFRQLAISFIIVCISGIIIVAFYYDY